MKKFFTFVLALVAVMAVNAKQVVFDFSSAASIQAMNLALPAAGKGTAISGQSIVLEGVTFSNEQKAKTETRVYNSNGVYDLRIYATSTFTFSAEENINAVAFNGSAIGFNEFTGNTWIGEAKSITVTANMTCKINTITVYIGETPEIWVADTINVAQARALIDAKDAHDHFVKGIVASQPFNTFSNFEGRVSFYLVDEMEGDSLQAYQVYNKKNAKWASLKDAWEELRIGDTVLVYAGALKLYAAKNIYEIDPGYYDSKLGANPNPPEIVDPSARELPEGVISCAAAVDSAKTIADPVEEKATVKGGEVKVRGYVTYAYAEKDGKQSAWLNDDKGAKSGLIQGAYLKVAEAVAVGDYVEIAGTLAKYKQASKDDKPAEIVLEVVDGTMVKIGDDGKPIEPAQPDTLSVAEAMRVGYALLDNAISPKKYVIKGYVSSIESYYDEQYKNETFWIADSVGSRAATNAGGAFYVYRGKIDTEKEIGLNALVYVTANITKYSKECKEPVIETAGGKGYTVSVAVAEQGLEETIDTINVAKAMEIGLAMEQGSATDNRYVITGYVSSIDVPFSEQYKNETFWITDTKGEKTSDKTKAFYVYRGKPNVEKEIGLGAKVSIICKIKNFKGTIENDGTGVTFEVLEEGEAPQIDTISVTEAIEIGMALEDGAYSEEIYVVEGYAVKAYAPDTCKTSQNVYMADYPEAYGKFYAYNCSPDELVKDGDYILVQGKIQKYVNAKGITIEVSNGAAVHGEPEIIPVTVTEATAIAKALDLTPVKDSIVTVTAKGLYEVSGYVIYVSKNGDCYLSDDKNAEASEFIAYKCQVVDDAEVAVGDEVIVLGAVQHRYDGLTETHYYQIADGIMEIVGGQGIENVVLTEKAQKVVVDGVLYIVRDNKMFNIQGTQVR